MIDFTNDEMTTLINQLITQVNLIQTALNNKASKKQLNDLNNLNQVRLANDEAAIAALQAQVNMLINQPR